MDFFFVFFFVVKLTFSKSVHSDSGHVVCFFFSPHDEFMQLKPFFAVTVVVMKPQTHSREWTRSLLWDNPADNLTGGGGLRRSQGQ